MKAMLFRLSISFKNKCNTQVLLIFSCEVTWIYLIHVKKIFAWHFDIKINIFKEIKRKALVSFVSHIRYTPPPKKKNV